MKCLLSRSVLFIPPKPLLFQAHRTFSQRLVLSVSIGNTNSSIISKARLTLWAAAFLSSDVFFIFFSELSRMDVPNGSRSCVSLVC